MVAITTQKSNLREFIHKAVLTRYHAMSDDGKEATVRGLVIRLSQRMTLRELEDWHFALYPPQAVQEPAP